MYFFVITSSHGILPRAHVWGGAQEKGAEWYPDTTFAQPFLLPAQSFQATLALRRCSQFPLPSEARSVQKLRSAWPSSESQAVSMTEVNDPIFKSRLQLLLGTEKFQSRSDLILI